MTWVTLHREALDSDFDPLVACVAFPAAGSTSRSLGLRKGPWEIFGEHVKILFLFKLPSVLSLRGHLHLSSAG